jgi:hypothetical protein
MTKSNQSGVHEFAGGALVFWTEGSSSLHIKAITSSGDPVELNFEELSAVLDALKRVSDEIE